MKKIKKIALFCMALAATTLFSVGCDMLLGGNNSSSSKHEATSTSSSSDKETSSNTSSTSKDENSSSTSKEETSGSTSKDENSSSTPIEESSSTSKEEDSSSTSKEENSSTSKEENSSSTSKEENSSTSKEEDSSSTSKEEDSSSSIQDENSSSSSKDEDSSSSSSSDSSSTIVPEYPDTYPENGDCVFGDWELFKEADCDTQGIKVRYCTLHEDHADYEAFAAREHDFDTLGVCTVCAESVMIPESNKNANYVNVADPNSGIYGSGHEYEQYRSIGEDEVEIIPNTGKYQLSVGGYYQIEIGNEGECWFEFAVPEAGQYAVISTSNPYDTVLKQYSSTGFLIGEARTLNDNNFISVASCKSVFWSEYWRAAFCITGSAGDIVNLYIAKVASPRWTPSFITMNKTATQLIGLAPDGEDGTTATDVPYDSQYFYDEVNGYYRMGTKTNPGAIIYMALTKNATRLMGEMSFVKLQTASTGIRYQVGTTVEGDYLLYDYAPMLYSDPYYNGTENSYQNFLNADGMYPVTQELYEFLKVYVANNDIATPPEETYQDNAWLAACFYYATLQLGSEGNPIKINTLETFTAQQYNKLRPVYYSFCYNPNPDAVGTVTTYCTISVSRNNVSLTLQGREYRNENGVNQIQNIAFEASSSAPLTFIFKTLDMTTDPIEVTLSVLEGSPETPIALAPLGEVALEPIEIVTLAGETKFEGYYSYTATEAGTLTLTTTSTAQILLGENTNVVDGSASISVAAGETVTVYVSSTNANPVNVNLTFTPTV